MQCSPHRLQWVVKNDGEVYSFGVNPYSVAKIFKNDKNIIVSDRAGLGGFDVGWTPTYRESDDAYT